MGITLPNGDSVSIPEVPVAIKTKYPEVYDYLGKVRVFMQEYSRNQFSNTFTVATAINSGTSGTFVMSSGGHLIVTSGIVIRITS